MRTDHLFLNLCVRIFVMASVLWFSVPAFAVDKALTSDLIPLSLYNECERLLDSDLSGHYVATTTFYKEKEPREISQLIQLRRLGSTAAYTVNIASMDLEPTGIRELYFVRTGNSWRIGDPARPDANVNIMTLARDEDRIIYRFENVSDRYGFFYDAIPATERPVDGDILHPNELNMDLISAFHGKVRLTRIKLDRAFEAVVSQALKSILATKMDPDSRDQSFNYLITVQMKSPLLTEEAAELLGDRNVFPLDAPPGGNLDGPFYRFAFPADVYKLLASVGGWTRSWKIAQIDAIPSHMVNPNLAQAITKHVQMQGRGEEPAAITHQAETQAEPQSVPPEKVTAPASVNAPAAAPTPVPQPPPRPEKSDRNQAIEHLQKLSGDVDQSERNGASSGKVESSTTHHPRNLDESRPEEEK